MTELICSRREHIRKPVEKRERAKEGTRPGLELTCWDYKANNEPIKLSRDDYD